MQTTFRQRLQSAPAVLAPGVYDALTALVAEQAGFESLYLSGASLAYTRSSSTLLDTKSGRAVPSLRVRTAAGP